MLLAIIVTDNMIYLPWLLLKSIKFEVHIPPAIYLFFHQVYLNTIFKCTLHDGL